MGRLGVRPDERRNVFGAFFLLLGILAAHVMVETARDALFLARLPVHHLPWLYVGIAVLSVVIAARYIERPSRRRVSLWLAGSALITLVFGLSAERDQTWTYYALYIWSGIFGTLALTQFWLLLGQMFTVTDAKRLFGPIGAGAVLGATLGAGSAAVLSTWLDPADLLIVAAGLLALVAAGPVALLRWSGDRDAPMVPPPRDDFRACYEAVWSHPFITRMAALVIASTVALTLADYIFKARVAATVPADELGLFFGTFYAALNGFALLVQLFFAGYLLRRLGVHRAQWVLPIVLGLGAAGALLTGAFAAVLVMKGADGGLRHSLHKTVVEVLYLPLPDRLRNHARAMIDTLVARGSQALGSLAILALIALGLDEMVLVPAVLVLAAAWIGIAVSLRSPYLDLFRERLREGSVETRPAFPELDMASLEAVIRALNSADDAEVMGALDLLATESRVALVPALLLYHPSQDVVLRTLDLFVQARRTDFVPVADRLLANGSPTIKAAVLRARSAVAPDSEVLERHANDDDELVRATALVGLISMGAFDADGDEALVKLGDTSAEARLAVAKAIAAQPHPAFAPILTKLAASDDPKVRRETYRAIGNLADPEFVPILIEGLRWRDVRTDAREALLAIGDPAFEALSHALEDLSLPHAIRHHLPRTLSRFPAQRSADVLLAHLHREPRDSVRYKILRGLGRLRSDHPELRFDQRLIHEAIEQNLRSAFELIAQQRSFERGAEADQARVTPGHELLVTWLKDRRRYVVERIFRLLGLAHPGEDFEPIYRGITSGVRKVHASGVELLDNLLEPALRDPITALIDDVPDDERIARAGAYAFPSRLDYTTLLTKLLDEGHRTLRALAAYHIGELGLDELRDQVSAVTPQPERTTANILERAVALLAQTARQRPITNST